MFGMSLPEIIVILVIAVLVLGPDKLPEALVKFAKFFKYFKAQVSSAKSNFEQEVRIAELKADAAKLKSSVTDISSNVRKKLTFEELDELKKSASDFSTELKSSLDFSQTNTSNEGSIENSRISSENSRIPSENSRISSENSRIPNELFEKIKIIYEDDDILVISKPSGLVVHEASSLKGESTLVDFLKQSGRQLATLGGEFRAGIVHRLDRYTSGVMVVAKSDFASAQLSSQLQQKTASRIYIALCDLPLKQNCVVERAIGRCENNRLKKAVYPLGKNGAKYAKSAFCNIFLDEVQNSQNSPKKNTPNIIAAKLFTGRTHQIRVHLSSINRHILGDVLYGFKGSCDIMRVFLHGYILELKHPRTGQMMSFCAPLEDDFAALIGVDTRTLNEKLTKNFVLSCFEPFNQWLCLS